MAGTAAGDLHGSVADAARAMVASGAETGLQIAVPHRGRLVADNPSQGTMTARGAAITFSGLDEVMGFPLTWAFGDSPARPGLPDRPGSAFGMVGSSGSAAYADISTGVAVAIMRNRFVTGDFAAAMRIGRLVASVF